MSKINNFTPEDFDKLKIFLITNYNIQFFTDPDSSIVESFEINTNEGKLVGHFYSENILELIASDQSQTHYEKILSYIKKLTKDSIETIVPDTPHVEFNNFLSNSQIFFDHVLKCTICKGKFLEILNHIK